MHGVPLAEFALLGLLYFAKGMPVLARAAGAAALGAPHDQRCCAAPGCSWSGSAASAREVARLLAAVGVQVVGAGRPGRSYDVDGVTEYVADTEICDVLGTVDALILACPLTSGPGT